MTKVDTLSCLVKGLKALRPKLVSSFIFALILYVGSTIPVWIYIFKSESLYYGPPISLWGFLMSPVSLTAQTLILVGVSQVVWGELKKASG